MGTPDMSPLRTRTIRRATLENKNSFVHAEKSLTRDTAFDSYRKFLLVRCLLSPLVSVVGHG